MGIAERRAREKEELRTRILEAATSLFVEDGYASVSIRKIADRIEYAPSTIYLYFKDKSDIIHSICDDTFRLLNEAMDEIGAKSLEPLEKLRQCLRCYVDFGLAHPNHYLVTFCTPEPQFEEDLGETCDTILETGLGTFGRLRTGIAHCMAAGVIAQDDVETTAQSAWAMCHGITSVLITMESFPFVEKDRLVASTVNRIVRSLQP